MGIQDRDYMRDRHRRNGDWSKDREKPFAPPRQETPLLWMLLCWIALGYVLYYGYGWWQNHRHTQYAARVQTLAATQHPQGVAQAQQEAPVEHVPPAQAPQLSRSTYSAPPAVPPQTPEPLRPQRIQPETGRTIYLCKAYNGSTFWAQAHCAQHQALIDSIISVPPGMPFEQQVRLAEEQRRQPTNVVASTSASSVSAPPAVATRAECPLLDARIAQLDAMAREPQSAQMQDWIREQRRAARDRQFALHC